MKQIESVLKALAAGAAALVLVLCGSHAETPSALNVKVTPNTPRLMPYQVFELTFQHEGGYADPTWDVTIDVTFTSPGGKKVSVGGFFYGSSKPQKPVIKEWKDDQGRTRTSATWTCDPADLWKARYAPSGLGAWKFDYVFQNDKGERARGSGTFRVVKGRVQSSGWVRIHPNNPFRFVFEDGSPYYPIGFQDGVFDGNHNGSAMDATAMEGPFRDDNADQRPKPPPGALFARGPSMNPVNGDVHFGRHARAGFNMWRFSPHNFSLDVFSLDRVNWAEARMVDEMLQLTRKYDIRNFYGIFGFMKVFNDDPKNVEGMAKVKRLIKYTVNRWGAYVDVWELLNEQKASDEWYAVVIPTLKSIDPYQKPIATSWERPELQGIDISAPHWYGREDELASDQVTTSHAAAQKKFGKPVVYGEQGNGGGKPELVPLGIGGVWDPGSARRMRVRLWSAFFHEISLVFWETSYAKDGHHMNIWLGPEERQYVHALQDFAHRLDAGIQMVKVHLVGRLANEVRAYGLRSDKRAAVYLHHSACAECAKLASSGDRRPHHWDHDRGEVKDLQVTLDVPRAAKGYWYSPTDASTLGRFDARAGQQTFTAPPFKIDLALLITEAGAPDVDHDGKSNDQDEDDDGDGVPDVRDAFPLEREEWADADADRIGDNLDADIDADGVADDRNNNGKPDNEEDDWDGDGFKNAAVIPWDAFPRDPKEWRDSDGDGVGDNADPDDDGDGYSDKEEKQAGTDPLDPARFPELQTRTDAHAPTVVASDWGTPVRLGEPINTPRPEDAIEISPDGKRLYFLRTTDVLEKLSPKEILSRPNGTYVAERVGGPGEFGSPRFYNLEKGIDLSLSGETSHTADGAMVYFHSVRPTNTGYQQKPPTNDILDIYAAKVVNGEPQAGVNLGPPVNSVYLDGEQFITPDGKTLYFTSSRPGGLGGNDIYVSHKTERGWSEPKNLGAPINSPRGESQSAFAFNDLKTMYFTSDRDPKIGVAIYRSTQQKDGSWGEPELVIKGLVGEPTLTADGSLLYFVHVLTDAKGVFDADVYYVQRKPPPPTPPARGNDIQLSAIGSASRRDARAQTDAPGGATYRLVKNSSHIAWEVGWGDNAQTNKEAEIEHGGQKRTFWVHLPPSYEQSQSLPVVLAFHGGGGTGQAMRRLTGLDATSDKEGFILVYPDGLNRRWADGRPQINPGVDDVGFVSTLIEHLAQNYKVDRKRIYATGISNGAHFCFRLACELPDKIAAFAPVGGLLSEALSQRWTPKKSVPLLIIHGTKDPLVPWDGGEVIVFGRKQGRVLSASQTVSFWVKHNGCATTPVITDEPDRNPRDGTKVRREEYGKGKEGSEVILYTIEGGGHTWPGGWQYAPELLVGKTCRDINANEVIWEFFKRHAK